MTKKFITKEYQMTIDQVTKNCKLQKDQLQNQINFKKYELKILQEKLKEKQMDILDKSKAIGKKLSKAILVDEAKYIKKN